MESRGNYTSSVEQTQQQQLRTPLPQQPLPRPPQLPHISHQLYHDSGHRVTMGVPARPPVSPLPHLHTVMAQSRGDLPGGLGPNPYSFGVPSASDPALHRTGHTTAAAATGTASSSASAASGAHNAYPDSRLPAYGRGGGVGDTDRMVNLYPSTLHPSRHIHAHQQLRQQSLEGHRHGQQRQQQLLSSHEGGAGIPIKLLQSCDSCRRRKIRCSGEKPTCSACIRYQEMCHYSPLATPRRRVGKKARIRTEASMNDRVKEPGSISAPMQPPSQTAPLAQTDGEAVRESESQAKQDTMAEQQLQPVPAAAAAETNAEEQTEGMRMQREISALSRKFDMLSDKLDSLLGVLGKRQRRSSASHSVSSVQDSESELEDDIGLSDDGIGESDAGGDTGGDAGGDGQRGTGRFANLIDKTSRFNLDATNIGTISDMISSIEKRAQEHQQHQQQQSQRSQPAEGVRVSSGPHNSPPTSTANSALAGLVASLESPEMRQHLLETFYLNADVNTISFIPRHIFQRLQREGRVPTAMISVMMADACNYSDMPGLMAGGRAHARAYYIECAYKALFECLEYDSAEHCVSLLLFAMVISKAGLHRAWIMHSLSSQMAIRLRFNTLDSPLSALAFKGDSELTREWKRRVFWQLYTFDILTSTLGDLPPCLSIHDVRCNAPSPVQAADDAQTDEHQLRMLGPAVVFCDDQQTIGLQIELLGIMCDISTLQMRMTPEESLFPPEFVSIHERIVAWQERMPHFAVLVEGNLLRISDVFQHRSGLIFLGMLCQYAQIFLCFIKDAWLPSTRAMTHEEEKRLAWARQTAYDSAQVVHRLVPFVRGMRLNIVCPFVSCVVFQACIVSLHSCAWWPSRKHPRRALAAVDSVQNGLDFLEHVAPRWGFAGVLTTSLQSLIVERGFGRKDDATRKETAGSQTPEDRNSQSATRQTSVDSGEDMEPRVVGKPLPVEKMQPFLEESQWERILRTGETPSLLHSDRSMCVSEYMNMVSNGSTGPNTSAGAEAAGVNGGNDESLKRPAVATAYGDRESESDTPLLDRVYELMMKRGQFQPSGRDGKQNNP